ncbi:predicted protein [Aspergillus nidulans FGSC A4]|uniref:Uncharacterized protein n=1 Tax=Emericella nidulans (strain FGSC A4 / ATCC 38163 / CBS 112.46 / NRRL 194 / M139) TaxID=227321 RepID=Q5BFY2_EMENI|nr:hypothetical protein [Aspergillus nidulans FGSC A4]EAA66647.1 predicted protein [Aspergillus nidulans FGSC A4]CBF89258.1 TPA: conserved hypothetical protein [Aspergillus nidulans FGSC A4]|eukprot:XP_658152.1 predicted protein [Aspergillus nidulans FGSC A4]
MVHPYLTQPDRGTYEMLWNRYQPTIMDNQQKFNSLPLSSVRSHFEEWAEQQDINRVLSSQRRACLVIDDEVIDALADARPWIAGGMDDVLDFHQNSLRWWVKVVEAWPDLEETYDDYDGSMKASIFALWRLWKDIKDPEPTMASLPRNEENGA